jgi:peptide/nickel transport system substrate-binding protein
VQTNELLVSFKNVSSQKENSQKEKTDMVEKNKSSGTLSRRDMLRLTGWAAGATLLAACGATETAEPTATSAPAEPTATAAPAATATPAVVKADQTVVLAVGSEPPSLDPQAIELRVPQTITDNVYEQLVDRTMEGELVPHLAEAWERVNDTAMRFKLREGVTFHNGEPFNADAVVYSVERIIDPDLQSQRMGTVGTIVGATKVDDMTVEIHTDGPDAILLARLFMLPIMSPGWTEEVGDAVSSTTNGTGPYKVIDWKRNVVVEMQANENYWQGAPKIPYANVRIIGEDSTRMQSLVTGELDIYLGPLPDQLPNLPKYESAYAPAFSLIRLSNYPGSAVKDPLVRQAMNYAVDKETLLSQLHRGMGRILDGQLTSPDFFGYNPNLKPYPYDLDRAKSLLAEAGAEGLTVDIVGPRGRYPNDAVECQAIADMLEKAGLKVDLSLVDVQSWVRFGNRDETPEPPAGWYLQHDNNLFDADRTVSGYYTDLSSWSAYQSEENLALIEQARVEMDPEAREKIYWQIYENGREDPIAVFLFQDVDLWAMSKRISYTPRPDGRALIYNMSLSS